MIKQIAVNGCSYMEMYCRGNGHVDLAARCNINLAHNLAVEGSANSRIIRSTLKHSYSTPTPTLYVLGLTFMSRWELPINDAGNEFEGRWTNPQAQTRHKLQLHWTDEDTHVFKELQFKSVAWAQIDQLEDLMFRLLSLLHDLRSRGHQALIYNQADESIPKTANDSRFQLLRDDPSFVHGLTWLAIPWQQQQGAGVSKYPESLKPPPMQFRHIIGGQHQHLNTYLTNYIEEYKMLS